MTITLLRPAPPPRPFLKWVGGKRSLWPQYQPRFPQEYGSYYEPFLGSGAIFFALQPRKAILTDINADLIAAFQSVKSRPRDLIALLAEYADLHAAHGKDFYNAVRDADADSWPTAERGARMIYLNKTCFNGLWRVNGKGKFNVPMGRYANPLICDAETIMRASDALQAATAEIYWARFTHVTTKAQMGDFVYFDPPYTPISSTSYFTSYTVGGFTTHDQEWLFVLGSHLTRRGVHVALSQSATPEVEHLYHTWKLHPIQARRAINSDASKRGAIPEVLLTNYS